MRRWGEAAIEAMEDVNGREYDVDPAGVAFKPAGEEQLSHFFVSFCGECIYFNIFLLVPGGASDDYAKGRAHIPYAATVELPGDDRWGLLLEEESFDGLMLCEEEDTVMK